MTTPTIDVRRAADRFATRIPWLDSHHSFSFGGHYDPANTHHGLLLVNNDDVVAPADLRDQLIARFAAAVGKDRHFSTRRHGVPPV